MILAIGGLLYVHFELTNAGSRMNGLVRYYLD